MSHRRLAVLAFTLLTLPGAALAQLQLPSSGQGLSATPSHPGVRAGVAPVPFDAGWLSLAGGQGTDMAQAVAAHPQGGAIAAGLTEWDPGQPADAWVARWSPWGGTVWQVAVGGAQHDEARALVVTSDGGCLLAGKTAVRVDDPASECPLVFEADEKS